MTSPTDMSNTKVVKFLSIETVISLLLISFSVGGTYKVLASDAAKTEKKVEQIVVDQKQMGKSIEGINTNIAVIKNDQKHIRQQLKDNQARMDRALIMLERMR